MKPLSANTVCFLHPVLFTFFAQRPAYRFGIALSSSFWLKWVRYGALHYRHDMSQQPLEDLVPPVAQEAVCVQRVLLAVKTQLHHVVFVLYFIPSGKCDLGRRPAEIERSNCGSAGAEPVPHKTILRRHDKGKGKQVSYFPFIIQSLRYLFLRHGIATGGRTSWAQWLSKFPRGDSDGLYHRFATGCHQSAFCIGFK